MSSEQLTNSEGLYLLSLARRSIQYFFRSGYLIDIKPQDVPSSNLVRQQASFVTLYDSMHVLRGCIGSLEASRPLIFDVAENAMNAAFRDPRFQPLSPRELPKIKITISILSIPKKLPVKSQEDLLSGLIPGKHGLILKSGIVRATFLPAVWEELPKKEKFLSELCLKAGLEHDCWKQLADLDFYTYEAQEFSE